jgi:fumarylacetoacetase
MNPHTDATHDPGLESWVESANAPDCDFPIQNLPLGRFRRGADEAWRLGMAIGDQVLDLRAAGLVAHADMNRLMTHRAQPLGGRCGSRPAPASGRGSAARWRVPCEIGDYTDFYAGIHHATRSASCSGPTPAAAELQVGADRLPRPCVVHRRERARSTFRRPHGQLKGPSGRRRTSPVPRLDYELEMGAFVGPGPTPPASRCRWRGRGRAVRRWRCSTTGRRATSRPGSTSRWGPFLSKSFASSMSPWIVTMEALAPFRRPFTRPEGDPRRCPTWTRRLQPRAGAIDIVLEVWLQTEAAMRASGHTGDRLMRSNFGDAYWTLAQLVAHHTVNGCNLRARRSARVRHAVGAGPEIRAARCSS